MQASHEKFVRLYYNKLRDEVDHFLETRWVPQFLANIVEGREESGKRFRADLDNAYRLAAVDWEAVLRIDGIEDGDVKTAIRGAVEQLTTRENATLGMVLLDFSTAVQEQVSKQRESLIKPIDQQEAYVLDQLRAVYTDLLRGTFAIKAHLASVAQLVEQRDAMLEKAGVLEAQQKTLRAAVALNDGAINALTSSRQAEEGITTFLENMDKTLKELKTIADSGE